VTDRVCGPGLQMEVFKATDERVINILTVHCYEAWGIGCMMILWPPLWDYLFLP
jgi:hypothetical protein